MDNKQYIKRLIQKGYSQINDNTFELHGSIFHLVNDVSQVTSTVSSGPFLISACDDIMSCANCKDNYYVDAWDDGNGFYRCGITGRMIGNYEDLAMEYCDQY